MTSFYDKYKDLFDGDGPISAPSQSFGNKQIHNQQQGGISTSLKDYKGLFEQDIIQPKKYPVGNVNFGGNYYQDSLDNILPKKFAQLDDISSKQQMRQNNSGQKDILNNDYLSQMNKYSNLPLEQPRANSRQSYKRDTLAANADRILQQDFNINYNKNSNNNNNLTFDNPFQNSKENQFKQNNAYLYPDGMAKFSSASNLNQGYQQKPPTYPFDKFDNQGVSVVKSRDQFSKSPIPIQQNNKIEQQYNNQNQQIYNKNKESQPIKIQQEQSPVNNVSKQRKYQEFYGNSILHQEDTNNKNNAFDMQDSSKNTTSVSTIPRQRGGINPSSDNNQHKQHFEERNQGLLDILFLKRRFADHKIINDPTGIPGQGQYKQALFNRLVSSKQQQGRKDKLKMLLQSEKVI